MIWCEKCSTLATKDTLLYLLEVLSCKHTGKGVNGEIENFASESKQNLKNEHWLKIIALICFVVSKY